MKNNLLQQEIEQECNLPVLPPGITNLFKTLSNENVTYDVVAEELEKFPAVAIKVVATANSSWAAPAMPITSLRDSCARLGPQLVLSIAIALSVSQSFNPARCPAFDSKKFWVSALLTAEAAHMGAKERNDICPDTARLAGLLHNIGLLWLAENKPDEVSEAVSISKNNNTSFAQILFENFDMDLYDVGGYLASSLELPQIIGTIIASSSLTTKIVETQNCTDTDPILDNHQNAQKLASIIQLHAKAKENEIENHVMIDDRPDITNLTKKLSSIEAMSKILFFN